MPALSGYCLELAAKWRDYAHRAPALAARGTGRLQLRLHLLTARRRAQREDRLLGTSDAADTGIAAAVFLAVTAARVFRGRPASGAIRASPFCESARQKRDILRASAHRRVFSDVARADAREDSPGARVRRALSAAQCAPGFADAGRMARALAALAAH